MSFHNFFSPKVLILKYMCLLLFSLTTLHSIDKWQIISPFF
jgi:hypothetical protein